MSTARSARIALLLCCVSTSAFAQTSGDVGRFFAGAALGLGVHESGHLILSGGDTIEIEDRHESVRAVVREFVGAVHDGRAPIIGADAELRVLALLEATTRSLDRGGTPVPVSWEGAP